MQSWKLALAALLLPLAGLAASVSIQLENGVFKVVGWQVTPEPAAGWGSIFNVYVGSGPQPMFGSYSVQDGTLAFRPRFGIQPGLYTAKFSPKGTEPVLAAWTLDGLRPAPATRVLAMYPSAPTLPSNQLKLYLTFSAPMRSGDVWPKIHLIDDTGKPAVLPFVELDQELWNPDHTRLTLLFDPGRIKRGVKPNVDMGPVLEEGKRYTLIIDRDFKDANGVPLAEPFRHDFTAGPAERRGIDPKLWRLSQPKPGTLEPLLIDFDRPLDYALLQDVFRIASSIGAGVSGTAASAPGESQWRFQPTQPWKSGDYNLMIDMALEDLAGNRIGRPFDVDTLTSPAERISQPTTSVSFRIPRP